MRRDQYQKHKAATADRQRSLSAAGRDIAPMPAVAQPKRKARAARDLAYFAKTYFPRAFYLKFSPDHVKVISKAQLAITAGLLFALAMPRGSGKTTLAKVAALWAVLNGHQPYVALIGANADRAGELLSGIKSEIQTNPLLLEDYPEAVYPIHALESIHNRAHGQTYLGQTTAVTWTGQKIALPTIAGSRAAGAIVTAAGIEGGNIRGQQHTRQDGTISRPTLVLIDDPQTRESAHSDLQTDRREAILAGDVLGMAGPGHAIAGMMSLTVIRQTDLADRMLDRKRHPHWRGERAKMLYSFPSRMDLWEEYAKRQAAEFVNDGDGHLATAYYAANRAAMDKGARVAWPERKGAAQLSGLQHAMDLHYRDPAAFAAEYQNAPLDPHPEGEFLTADGITRKTNGHPRGTVPAEAQLLTAHIDVHDRVLYYAVAAWTAENATGHVVDYGTHPDQKRPFFSLRSATATLGRAYPGKGADGAILAGLVDLIDRLTAREWPATDGSARQLDRGLVDAGYKPDIVAAAIRTSGHATAWLPAIGIPIRATNKPLNEYNAQPGDRVGTRWRITRPKTSRRGRQAQVDTNWWKSRVHAALATAAGDPGALYLYGKDPRRHRHLAEHLTAEYRTRVEARGRAVDEWAQKPGKPDNHWLDTIVGAAVAGSIAGAAMPGTTQKRRGRRRRHVSDMQASR